MIKLFLVIAAVLGLLFGLGFALRPAQVLSTFGIRADPALEHMARNFGSALLAIAAMSWAARNAADSVARRAIILALFIYFALGSISILLFQLTGIPNSSAWFNLAFHIPLAVVFGHLVFSQRGAVGS